MPRGDSVGRPRKKTDFTIVFGNRSAERGWRNLEAVRANALADTWDYLTASPTTASPLCSPLKGNLATIERSGQVFSVWQIKLNLSDGARIWFYVDGTTVILEQVHTAHPNETK